jgi:hypothetical protein
MSICVSGVLEQKILQSWGGCGPSCWREVRIDGTWVKSNQVRVEVKMESWFPRWQTIDEACLTDGQAAHVGKQEGKTLRERTAAALEVSTAGRWERDVSAGI